ncbi:alpha/beta hydrolase [Nocardioides bigeumensis]|uniref:Alpha/beta hydrolase n=1 Tax=Nocardioides bigeumensis TaxID=433657 RepID=A0ABN2YH59_9ACTN
MLTRRTLLGVGVAGGAMLATGCADDDPVDEPVDEPVEGEVADVPGSETITYGDDPSQLVQLTRPDSNSRGVVVVVHGGFWKAAYGAELGAPLAADLAARGWTTLNVEYRRVGNGGGVPETLDDVAAAIDVLRSADVDLTRVVTLGHSAGGHLATWAAARTRFDRWSGGVPVTAVISQAGVLDLEAAYDAGLGSGAVEAFVGSPPGPAYDQVDPARQLPLDVPVWCVHGRDDDVVPLSQSADYVSRATAAGAQAELVEVEGDHFVVIDTGSDPWSRIVTILDGLG